MFIERNTDFMETYIYIRLLLYIYQIRISIIDRIAPISLKLEDSVENRKKNIKGLEENSNVNIKLSDEKG